MKTLLYIFAGSAISCGVAIFWWHMWMYHGLIGSPKFLAPIMKTDGEAAYDRVGLEMFLIVFGAVTLAILIHGSRNAVRKNVIEADNKSQYCQNELRFNPTELGAFPNRTITAKTVRHSEPVFRTCMGKKR